jgi:bifunctional non-homologous end joining protein LigD
VGTGFSDRQLEDLESASIRSSERFARATGDVPKGRDHVWYESRARLRGALQGMDRGRPAPPSRVRALRDDKKPEECWTRSNDVETIEEVAGRPSPADRTGRFTNLDKVFWPEEGYTKGDLIAYYQAISPWILHYLRDRPLVMTRYPDGINGKSFFQKDAPGFGPAGSARSGCGASTAGARSTTSSATTSRRFST